MHTISGSLKYFFSEQSKLLNTCTKFMLLKNRVLLICWKNIQLVEFNISMFNI